MNRQLLITNAELMIKLYKRLRVYNHLIQFIDSSGYIFMNSGATVRDVKRLCFALFYLP
jgi:hypothetical protein